MHVTWSVLNSPPKIQTRHSCVSSRCAHGQCCKLCRCLCMDVCAWGSPSSHTIMIPACRQSCAETVSCNELCHPHRLQLHIQNPQMDLVLELVFSGSPSGKTEVLGEHFAFGRQYNTDVEKLLPRFPSLYPLPPAQMQYCSECAWQHWSPACDQRDTEKTAIKVHRVVAFHVESV